MAQVWLTRPDGKLKCKVTFDNSTYADYEIKSQSLRGAEREITGWMIKQGFRPSGDWQGTLQTGTTIRQFEKQPMSDMAEEHWSKKGTLMNGSLILDTLNGTAEFKDGWGQTILRVTHLQTPIPNNVMIDVVAIRNVTSYTPITGQEQAPPLGKDRRE